MACSKRDGLGFVLARPAGLAQSLVIAKCHGAVLCISTGLQEVHASYKESLMAFMTPDIFVC